MNSYELIETYPGSPGLGTIVVDTNINNGAKDGYFSENWGKPAAFINQILNLKTNI